MKRLSMYHLSVLLCLLVLSGCVADTALPVGTTPASTISPASTTTSTSLLEPPVRAEVPSAVTASPVPLTVEAAPCPAVGPSPSLRCDKEVLLAVRDRLRGEHRDQLPTWHPIKGIEYFEGVILGDDPRRVIGLEMVGVQCSHSSCGSNGAVPWQLSRLPRLERLVLRENGLLGSIPPALGQLPRLQQLDLSDNWLRETIPAELGQLRELRELQLQANLLRGPIPPELGRLAHLRVLDLGGNNALTGYIPPALVPVCECSALPRCE